MICICCHEEIPHDTEYACVWIKERGKLNVGFAHLTCSEQFEDITDEVTTGKRDVRSD